MIDEARRILSSIEFYTMTGWVGFRAWRGEFSKTLHIELGWWQLRIGGDPWAGK